MAGEHFHEIKGYGSNELDSALRSVLKRGERVLWKGRPRVSKTFAPFLIWLFAIPWTGFSLVWVLGTWTMAHTNAPDDAGMQIAALIFPAFGLPFVFVGLCMMAAPLFAMGLPGRSLYAVTDMRVLRIAGGWKTSLRAIPAEHVIAVEARAKPDGNGTLVITHGHVEVRKPRMRHRPDAEDTSRFVVHHLPNVRDAARAIERLRLNSAASSLSAGSHKSE
ncbi:PH domain-containing protein [Croceicoccus bisphenolivorans]|uniref:PH domain-containing protein n=1 Tax=Croceicoccus bisphenolivorans TaxID=1783232 RepID=UPI001C12BD93|nr:PH domain-containing protein [Croceicoccus bisphenolivorans]